MQVTKGIQGTALKVVVYGPEGIGKSTFAARFPNPVFIDTEGSTKWMDVARTPAPSSWTMLMEQVEYFLSRPNECGTLVIDTADWAEQMCKQKVCADGQKTGIEDFGYGKGYVYLQENFGKLLNKLEDLVRKNVHVVITSHAMMRKFEQPDEMGSYDRWELKLEKKVAPLVKEWADIMLFANYKTVVVNVDDQGAAKGKNKVQGGKRVMYATHHPCWDAKNRHGLADELPFDYEHVAHLIQSHAMVPAPQPLPDMGNPITTPAPSEAGIPVSPPAPAPAPAVPTAPEQKPVFTELPQEPEGDWTGIPRGLADLMREAKIVPHEIQQAVAKKGYFPSSTPIANYPMDFVQGVLIGAWPQIRTFVEADPNRLPF